MVNSILHVAVDWETSTVVRRRDLWISSASNVWCLEPRQRRGNTSWYFLHNLIPKWDSLSRSTLSSDTTLLFELLYVCTTRYFCLCKHSTDMGDRRLVAKEMSSGGSTAPSCDWGKADRLFSLLEDHSMWIWVWRNVPLLKLCLSLDSLSQSQSQDVF